MMQESCDRRVLSFLSAGLSVATILSYWQTQTLLAQLEKCQSQHMYCEEMKQTIVKNVYEEIFTFKQYIPSDKVKDFVRFERYITSLSPVLSRHTTQDIRTPVYSCPEHFVPKSGWPWTKGFIRENCTRPKISESTTLILAYPVIDRLLGIVQTASRMFNHIILILNRTDSEISKGLGLKKPRNFTLTTVVIPSKLGYSYGDALNNAIDLVTSHFVLIAPHIGSLDANLDVERLIHVFERVGADVVGGAVKDASTGEWYRGCYQTKLKLYTLKLTEGYYISQLECLYCDYIISPFLTTTDFLKKYRFSKYNHGVLRDLFLRLTKDGRKILTCPDVMFYVNKHEEDELQLAYFAEQWNIRRIIEPDNTVLWFGFRAGLKHRRTIDFRILDTKYKPEITCGAFPTISISPDCRHNLLDAIILLLELCKTRNIYCQLEEGTLLGVMKFNHILPWERDADITFLSRQFEDVKRLNDVLHRRGIQFDVIEESKVVNGEHSGGVFYVKVYGWLIEMYGTTTLMKRTEPYTVVNLANHWVYAPENPGLYVRNRYGREVYRHAEHWRANNEKHGFTEYVSGRFPECIGSTRHACLDQFHADGSIQFLEYL